jgi:hypothetical protein
MQSNNNNNNNNNNNYYYYYYHYYYYYKIMIRKLLDCISNTRWEPKSPYRRSYSIHGDFSSVRLATQDVT